MLVRNVKKIIESHVGLESSTKRGKTSVMIETISSAEVARQPRRTQ